MPGRQRRRSINQSRAENTFTQKDFRGQDIDTPASELGHKVSGGLTSSVLARMENAVSRIKYSEARRGTERFSYAKMPGTGVIYAAPKYHLTSQIWIFHRGTQIWKADKDANYWVEISALSSTIAGDYSTISPFNDDFVINTKNGLYYVDVSNEEYFKFNSACPQNRGIDSTGTSSASFTSADTDDLLTVTDADYVVGQRVYLTGASLGGGLTANVLYYAIPVSATTFKLADSDDNANSGIAVPITSNGSGIVVRNLDYTYRYVFTFMRMIKTDGSSASGLDREHPSVVILSETGTKQPYGVDTRDYVEVKATDAISKDHGATVQPVKTAAFTDTDVNASSNTIDVGVELDTGMIVNIEKAVGIMPNPLQVDTEYYVIGSTSTACKLAYTLDDALEGTAIDLIDIGDGNTATMRIYWSYGKDDCQTHFGLYRTLNINNSTDDGKDPVQGTGNNQEIYSWVADIDIDESSGYTDSISDAELRAQMASSRDPKLAKMRGFIPLPNGEVGFVSQGWLFSAVRGEPALSYSSITDLQKRFGGHYSPFQFHEFNQGIQQLAGTPDSLIVCCNNQTFPVTLTSFKNMGLLEFVPQLDHFPEGDKTIGVRDWGTIVEAEKNTIIAVCSDSSVRVWDGTRWGDDLSRDLVNTEVRKFVTGSVAAYFAGRLYIWYRTDSTVGYNNKCMRLGLTKEAGRGWSFCTGSHWIYPHLYTGAMLAQDKNNVQKLVVLDYNDNYLYWLSTYVDSTGSRSVVDKKIDGGFCALGDKYFYDEMDDNTVGPGLEVGTVNLGSATEISGYMRMRSDEAFLHKARVLCTTKINSGDIEASVRHTHQTHSTDVVTKWEVKCANFSSTTDQIDINELNQGFLAYVQGLNNNTGTYTGAYKFLAGSTEVTGTVALSSRPQKIKVKRVSNTLSVFMDDNQIVSNENAAWGTLSNMQASFCYDGNDNYSAQLDSAGFNAFHVVNSAMPNDCLGVDGQGSDTVPSDKRIASLLRFMEITGNEESNEVKTRESHTYLRPIALSNFHSGFQVNWKSYKDGSTVAKETVNKVQHDGDIQNWREIEGRRIQHEVIPNMADWKMTGMDTHYWSENKKDILNDPASTIEADYQEEVAADLDFWIARRDYTLNRADGTVITTSDDAVYKLVVGPDGDSNGAYSMVPSGCQTLLESSAGTELASDFAFCGWIKGDDTGTFFSIVGTSSLSFRLSTQTIRIGTTLITIGTRTADEWTNYWIVRRSGIIYVYRNAILKGSFSDSATYGGINYSTILTSDSWIIADFRMKTAQVSEEAITYYYDNVLESGDKVLPL